eukprot:gnl/MRDRNA2_/MRDRNA2_72131_c1_seq1.p1 gnl/MRDRNA2_/MRDRNA2_72131_c1~~gnl/MRDRNA2_/MRDRNA2_72131_c1_seq1.p1  ORF type:complete len:243 (+),score=37.13 gnl/MRDRNA2_/MRDRNA2_72131_c1_seq1:74-802(+)
MVVSLSFPCLNFLCLALLPDVEVLAAPQPPPTEFGDKEYWEKRYSKPAKGYDQDKGYDWYGPWSYFRDSVSGPAFRPEDKILVVGCGNSNLSTDLVSEGFTHVTSMDWSAQVIKLMQERYPDMNWIEANVRQMQGVFESSSFDVVIDKGTLDALRTWRKGIEHQEMFSEVSRVLRPSGRYVSVTFGTPKQLDTKYYFRNASYGWEVSVKGLPKYYTSAGTKEGEEHYVYTMTKLALGTKAEL